MSFHEDAELFAIATRFLALCRAPAPQPNAEVLAAIQHTLHELLQEIHTMSDTIAAELSQLQADVAAQSTVIASATTAFQGLAAQLAAAEKAATDAGVTPEQLAGFAAVRTGLEANTAALSAAIPANTPAQPQSPVATLTTSGEAATLTTGA